MNVVWAPEARQDREDIFNDLAARDPFAAIAYDEQFETAGADLARFPMMGTSGKIQGTRELLHIKPYRLVYDVVGNTVQILALVHMSRLWPPMA